MAGAPASLQRASSVLADDCTADVETYIGAHKPCSLMMLMLDPRLEQAGSRRQARSGAEASALGQGSASSSTSAAGAAADLQLAVCSPVTRLYTSTKSPTPLQAHTASLPTQRCEYPATVLADTAYYQANSSPGGVLKQPHGSDVVLQCRQHPECNLPMQMRE